MNLSGVDVVDEPTTPIYDPENLEKCLAFAGMFRLYSSMLNWSLGRGGTNELGIGIFSTLSFG